MILNEDIEDTEKSGEICSFSESFLHPSILSIIHSRSA